MAYRNPIEDLLGGAFRAVMGPVLAPFFMVAMGLAHLLAPFMVHHHYLVKWIGTKVEYAPNMLTTIIFGLMLVSPIIIYIVILACRLVRWFFTSLAGIEWKRKEKKETPKILHEKPSFPPRFGNDYYYPKFKKDELNL